VLWSQWMETYDTGIVVHVSQELKPTVIIGTTGKGGQFTQEVLEEFSSYQEVRPLKLFPILWIIYLQKYVSLWKIHG
jgi:hypothetical protein